MEMECGGFHRQAEVWSQDSLLDEMPFLPNPLSPLRGWGTRAAAPAPKVACPDPRAQSAALCFSFRLSLYLLDKQGEVVTGAVLLGPCISISLQFLLGRLVSVCVSPCVDRQEAPESHSCSLQSSRILLITLSPTVWLSPFVSERKGTGINMFSRLRENTGM